MALGAPFHCCRLTHWMPRLAASTPPLVSCLRGKVPRPTMVSSNQKRFQLCFVRNSPRGTSEPRVFHQNENPAESAFGGGVSGTLIWWCPKGFCYEGSVSQIHGRAKSSSRNELVGFGWEARRDEPDREGTNMSSETVYLGIPPPFRKGPPGPWGRCVFPGAGWGGRASFKRMQLGGMPVSTFLMEHRAVG